MNIELPEVKPVVRVILIVLAVLAPVATHLAAYLVGRADGKSVAADARLADAQRAYQADRNRVEGDIERGQKAGARADKSSQRVERYYKKLEEEAHHDATTPIDDYVLPDERLQRWRAANAGPFASAPATEPDASPRASAATAERAGKGSGGQSP